MADEPRSKADAGSENLHHRPQPTGGSVRSRSAASPASERPWHLCPVPEVLEALGSEAGRGLTSERAAARLAETGPNELVERRGRGPLAIFWDQVSSVMVLILIAAAVISGLLGKTTETLAIAAIVVLFTLLGFVQEYRAEKAMAALKRMAKPLVRVRRDGSVRELPARELVPGDVVLLEAGTVVPADARVIESAALRVQEAALTGESEPVEKQTGALEQADAPVGDRTNLAFMGTAVTFGRGEAVVVSTGMDTELGRIAELIQGVETGQTPLQKRLDRVGKALAVIGVAVAAIIVGIGLLQGEELSDMFLTAVSVAVAVVPEGLPAVVTVTLALGAQRMLRRKALIRKLPAVETLGSVTTICSDKTGTLTENRMTVTVVDVAGETIDLVGTAPRAGEALRTGAGRDWLSQMTPGLALVLAGGALCNDASMVEEGAGEAGAGDEDAPQGPESSATGPAAGAGEPGPVAAQPKALGDPTEGALLVAAAQGGLRQATLQKSLPRVGELPFESDRKRMSTVHRLPGSADALPPPLGVLYDGQHSHLAITKGAVDGMMDVCDRIWVDGELRALDESWRARIEEANAQMAGNGMRVLGVGMRWLDDPEDLAEEDIVFLGLVGMIDPPRAEVKDAVATCISAGIRPVMITGDHPLTARFIAWELGISDDARVVTGRELAEMTGEALDAAVEDVSVFARVSPEHKLRIVESLQRKGEVVAMTGDGVNDSPALRRADIGIAMGITGTDVSKEASEMVLLDDNFATIVSAVEEGRVIFANIRRFVKFSIAGNLGKVLVMLLAPFAGITVALLPLQLLWLNLLTDGLLGLGLGLEPSEPGVMKEPPRAPKAPFFPRPMLTQLIWVGAVIGALALGVGLWYHEPGDPAGARWQTMIFTSLAFLQVGQALASRSSRVSFFRLGLLTNKPLLAMVVLVIGLQLVVLYVPFLDRFFQIVPLGGVDLAICAGLGLVLFALLEVEKWLVHRRRRTSTEAASAG